MQADSKLIERFHKILVEEIHRESPGYLTSSFTVAEIYQSLIPYRTHRDRLGVEINGDYEDTLLRLLAGEGEYLILESEPARARIRRELQQSNPNTGIYRDFAAVSVRLDPRRVPDRGGAQVGSGPNGLQTSLEAFAGDAVEDVDLREAAAHVSTEGGTSTSAAQRLAAEPTYDEPDHGPPSGCPECREPLPPRESVRFCPACGANVRTVPCGSCGETLERSWRYCVACGAPAPG